MITESANFVQNGDTDDKEASISIVNKVRSRLFQTPNSRNSRTGKKKFFAVLLLIILLVIGFIAWQVASISSLQSAPSASPETAPQPIESGAISQPKSEVIIPKPPPPPQSVYWSQFSSELLHLEREQTVLVTALSKLLPARIPVDSSEYPSPVSSVNPRFLPTEIAPNINLTEKLPTNSDLAVQIEAIPNSWSAFGNQLIQLEQQRQQFLQNSKN